MRNTTFRQQDITAEFIDLVEHEDYIVQDEAGEAKFVHDTEFKK